MEHSFRFVEVYFKVHLLPFGQMTDLDSPLHWMFVCSGTAMLCDAISLDPQVGVMLLVYRGNSGVKLALVDLFCHLCW